MLVVEDSALLMIRHAMNDLCSGVMSHDQVVYTPLFYDAWQFTVQNLDQLVSTGPQFTHTEP